MALTITELSAYTHNFIVPKSTEVIFLNSPVLTRLSQRQQERFAGGLQIQRPLMVGRLKGGAIGRGDAMNIDYVVTDTALVEDLKVYYVNITLYGFDALKNESELSVFNQVELKFQNAGLTMAELLATNMYLDNVGPRAKHLTGLPQWYDDGNTYAAIGGITRADIMANGTVGGLNAYTATLNAFNLRLLNQAYGNAWFGADHVDMIVATQNGWNMTWEALQPQQRYYDTQSDVAKSGFQALRFNAAEMVVDKYMPTGTNGVMYGLNTKYVEWYFSTHPKFQFGFTGFKEFGDTIDVCGQFMVANQLVVPNPRSGFKLLYNQF